MRTPDIAKLVTFGVGGDTVHLGRHNTISGYGNPDRPHAAEQDDDLIIPDGTPVIDKRPAVKTDRGYRWAIRGPMVDVDLQDGDTDRCPEPGPMFAEAVADNWFGALLSLQSASRDADEARGPLDSVSTAEYVRGWKEHGARIGQYVGGEIVWEGGAR